DQRGRRDATVGTLRTMERHLRDLDIWCWRYLENKSNYPGLHFTARPTACTAISLCVDALLAARVDVHRTVNLKVLQPADEAKVSGGQKYRCFKKLRIAIHSSSDRLRQMSFRQEGDVVHFDFTSEHVAPFLRAL